MAVANELKSILLSQQQQPNNNKQEQQPKARIEELIQILTDAKVQFDPSTCINGPLYAVLYQSGPVPFWEKFDFKFLKRNIKGQQFTSSTTTGAGTDASTDAGGSSSSSFDVVNYAEFWGNDLNIQASGVGTLIEESTSTSTSTSNLLSCPIDYKVKIQNASINILQNKLKLNVSGIGYTRILYANEDIRILFAPKDTTDDTWMEKAGLAVVQVRCDLVTDSDFVL